MENKDEDGDGVPDEQDDYPFDADKTTITVVQEEEFNNNVTEANPVGTVPFQLKVYCLYRQISMTLNLLLQKQMCKAVKITEFYCARAVFAVSSAARYFQK
ncbi:hypothetical protein ACOBV8_18055 [Pseudoalteromonas espejiana]